MSPANVQWQFCKDGYGYESDYFDGDADEIRQWREDGILLIAFARTGDNWYVSASDVFDWVPFSDTPVEIDFGMEYPGTLIA